MILEETIKTWQWRIKRVGHTQKTFCSTIQVSTSAMSQYINLKKDPSMKSFNKIEGKLQELEREGGIV